MIVFALIVASLVGFCVGAAVGYVFGDGNGYDRGIKVRAKDDETIAWLKRGAL
jgi:hypothetical protein